MSGFAKPGRRPDGALAVAAVLAAFLNLYGVWNETNVNAYYTAAVASMMQNLHAFFYASLDSAGFVTVDKPPLAFWIQTLSAKLFGLRGWSVILPQALAGVGSVLLVYALAKPSFGRTAARLAAFAMACMPVAAAVSRTNNVDAMLVFALLAATWLLFKGVRGTKPGWTIAAFAVVGIGFNIKMLQAYMVLPAFYLFYWIAFRTRLSRKLSTLAVATAALVVVSLSWCAYVDSVPQGERPYIGSSQTNSVLELAFGYNGLSRLTGERGMGGGEAVWPGGPGGFGGPIRQSGSDGRNRTGWQGGQGGQGGQAGLNVQREPGRQINGFPGGAPPGIGGRGAGGPFNNGAKGPLRLFRSELSGQVSWLLPFAGFAALGLLSTARRRQSLTDKHKETLFWLAWLLPGMAFFSAAGFFHSYYLIMLAPPIAALVGSGWAALGSFYRERKDWRSYLLPAAVLATTAFQTYVLLPYADTLGKGWPFALGGAGSLLAVLLAARLLEGRLAARATAAAVALLLLAPAYWSATPIIYGQNSQLPAAGPSVRGDFGGAGAGRGGTAATADEGLYEYLLAHRTGETYLFATNSVETAEACIIGTGQAVMAMGGFSGNDPILTVEKLERMVRAGEVHYFYLTGGRGGNSEIARWIAENGKMIPRAEYAGSVEAAAGSAGGAVRQEGARLQAGPGVGVPGGFVRDERFDSGTLYELTST